MGQAWCKERTTKAQDSKSPLDRVFVRCAHQIYPTLKQDGSVLGGATQRVTSSEIGYAGSPPREALTRGESVDSIDRPFHPSEWVDVNLEVPSTPSSVITNLTANTSLYQTTTLSSTGSNLKNITPIPPPRRRRKNRGRPLPPKPDEIIKTHGNLLKSSKKVEPLYSSVKSKLKDASEGKEKSISNHEEEGNAEFKVNGAERILAISEVTEGDRWTTSDPGDTVREEQAHHQNGGYHQDATPNENKNKNNKKNKNNNGEDKTGNNQDLEYEKFWKSRELRSSSTPNGPGKNPERKSSPSKELREFVARTIMDDDDILEAVNHRTKNYSTVSLPNYDELEVVKNEVDREAQDEESPLVIPKKPRRSRNLSTISLPVDEIVESLPEGTTDRIEKYMTRCRSFGSLQPHEILDKLKAHVAAEAESSDEDEWGGLDDWDLGVIEDSEPSDGRSPLEPSSRLRERKVTAPPPMFVIGGGDDEPKKNEPVTVAKEPDLPEKEKSQKIEEDSFKIDPKFLSLPRNASFEMPKSPNSILKSALKAEVNRKISMPARFSSEKPGSPLEEWFSAQERSVRFFEVPKLEEEYANTPGHRPAKPSEIRKNPDAEYDTRSYPFNGTPVGPLDIDTFFGEDQDSGGTKNPREFPDRRERARNLTRSLSNESEPFDGYEEKELTLDIRSQPSSIGKLSRTISDESIPPEMAEESMGEKETAKSQDSRTPPPSPEPKIHPEILKVDNFNGAIKIQREDGAESNLSSMTPSLTELEAALSDMLEKEDQDDPRTGQDHVEDLEGSNLRHSEADHSLDKPIEPKILPKPSERDSSPGEEASKGGSGIFVRRRKENVAVSLGQILNNSAIGETMKITGTEGNLTLEGGGKFDVEISKGGSQKVAKGDKAPGRNPFEDTDDEGDSDDHFGGGFNPSKVGPDAGSRPANPFDAEPPEKPSRLQKVPLDRSRSGTPEVPTPPQRKNKLGAVSPTSKSPTGHMESEFPIRDSTPHPNDRLI